MLDGSPDAVALPVGNAGNITAAWRGFTAYAGAGRTEGRPRMLGFQAVGAAPIVDGAPWPTRDRGDRDPDRKPRLVGWGHGRS